MNRAVLVGVLVLAAAAFGTPVAEAIPTLQLSDGVNTVTITDGGPGDWSPNTGAITFVGSVGAFTINVSTGLSTPALGASNAPHLDLSSINITSSGGGGTLTIRFTDVDLPPLESSLTGFTSSIGGVSGGSLTFSTYVDGSNTPFGQGTLLGSTSYGAGAFSGSFSATLQPGSYPYSLTEVVTLTLPAQSASSFNAELQATPEPGSLLLLGSGLLGLGFVTRRGVVRVKSLRKRGARNLAKSVTVK